MVLAAVPGGSAEASVPNAAAWQAVQVQPPGGSMNAQFLALSCPSAQACTAGGFYQGTGLPGAEAIVAAGSGSTWAAAQTITMPAGARARRRSAWPSAVTQPASAWP